MLFLFYYRTEFPLCRGRLSSMLFYNGNQSNNFDGITVTETKSTDTLKIPVEICDIKFLCDSLDSIIILFLLNRLGAGDHIKYKIKDVMR